MAITLDTIAAGMAAADSLRPFYKTSGVAEAAATWHSMWKIAGIPVAGAIPSLFTAGAGYVPTRATVGALGQPDPIAGNNRYITQVSMTSTAGCWLTIYDRMWHCSGFGTVVTTAQNVTTPGVLPTGRDPNTGADVEPWLEVWLGPGATAATWTLTGTDSTGTAGRTWTYAHPANAETAGQMMPMVQGTAVGGCRVPASFTASISSGVAGDIGVTLLRRLCTIPITAVANVPGGTTIDAFATGMPEVYDDACIAVNLLLTTGAYGVTVGHISIPSITP